MIVSLPLTKGIAPRLADEVLPDGYAAQATNCKLSRGRLEPWRTNGAVDTLVDAAGALSLFRHGAEWLTWTVATWIARCPVARDAFSRIYTANGTETRVINALDVNGDPEATYPAGYLLGVPAPVHALQASATGGDANYPETIPYVYCYRNIFGDLSAPSPAASVVRNQGGTATLIIPAYPESGNYAPLSAIELYRGNMGSASTEYLYVGEKTVAVPVSTVSHEHISATFGTETTAIVFTVFYLDISTPKGWLLLTVVEYPTRLWLLPILSNAAEVIAFEQVIVKIVQLSQLVTRLDGNVAQFYIQLANEQELVLDITYNSDSVTWSTREITRITSMSGITLSSGVPVSDSQNPDYNPTNYLVGTVVLSIGDPNTTYTAVVGETFPDRIEIHTNMILPLPSTRYITMPSDVRYLFKTSDITSRVYVILSDYSIYGLEINYVSGSLPTVTLVREINYFDSLASADLSTQLLASTTWEPPPAGLTGVINMPDGSLCGFAGNSVYRSVAFHNHAWPPVEGYRVSVPWPVVAVANAGMICLVLTEGLSYVIGGSLGALTYEQMDISYACSSARSVADVGDAVIYASPVGLVAFSAQGASVLTKDLIEPEQWQTRFFPTTIHGYQYGGRYVGFYSSGDAAGGFVLTMDGTFTELDFYASAGWYDQSAGALYLVVDGVITQFDAGTATVSHTYTGPVQRLPGYTSFASAKVRVNGRVDFKLYTWSNGTRELLHSRTITSGEPFSLPHARSSAVQIEISGTGIITPPIVVGTNREEVAAA